MKKAWLLLGLAGIALLDYLSPQSLTLSLFYGMLCLQTGSTLGGRAAVWMALASVSLHCAVNGFPHPWYLAALQDLCEMCLLVIVGLEAALVRSKITETRAIHSRLRSHLESAREVQKALLRPPSLSEIPIEFSLRFDIAVELGGDLFFVQPGPGGLLFCVADVSGKGPAAALISSLLRGLLEELAAQAVGPAHLLARVQTRLLGMLPENTFVTCFCGYLDYASSTITYASAGHDPPFLRTSEGLVDLPCQSIPLGIDSEAPLEETLLTFASGDLLLVYTDGLTDARQGDTRVRLGDEKVRQILLNHQGSCEQLTDALFSLLPAPLADDVMLLALRCP
ncbi:serine/threonine-protein phosphatase [bacterium]|nr:serine/threonine-protein phosphatase [bacterium]